MKTSKKVAIDSSLQLVWIMANTEAYQNNSSFIEPIHYLLAIMNLFDGSYQSYIRQLGYSDEVFYSIKETLCVSQKVLGMTMEDVSKVSHALHKLLKRDESKQPIRMLHRSPESRVLFEQAALATLEIGNTKMKTISILEQLLKHIPHEAALFIRSSRN